MAIGVLAVGFWIRLSLRVQRLLRGTGKPRPFQCQAARHLRRDEAARASTVSRDDVVAFLGLAPFVWLWSVALARGSYGLAVLAWYGTGRLFLEPLHEEPSIVFGRVRIDRVVAALLALCAGGALALVAAASLPAVRLYDSNPAHLWNRLHASLFVRVTADGREYGADRVDPLLWVGSRYLLQGPSHVQAITLLNEFIETHGEQLLRDPLKRGILQRDLWTVFDWLEGSHAPYQQPQLIPEVVRKGVEDLRQPLATVIARLALTPEEIRTLPDNYAATARPNALPPDLFQPDGPWVSVGRPDGPIARHHLRDDGPGKNSVFLVLIRLPGGRDATLKYLDALRSFSGPLWMHDANQPRYLQDYPNPNLPQFPVGTQVALVRRALLIDSTGRIAPTRLTEQVQLRTHRAISAMTAQEFADAQRIDENMFARAGQDFEEFSLSRAALFGERAGGLLPLAALDRFFLTFSSHGVDFFDMRSGQSSLATQDDPAHAAKLGCKDCHGAPGVYSFNSYVPFRLAGPGFTQAPRLSEISLVDAERVAVAWKQQQVDWGRLQPLLRGPLKLRDHPGQRQP